MKRWREEIERWESKKLGDGASFSSRIMKSMSSALKIQQSFAMVWEVFVNRQRRKCSNCLAVMF